MRTSLPPLLLFLLLAGLLLEGGEAVELADVLLAGEEEVVVDLRLGVRLLLRSLRVRRREMREALVREVRRERHAESGERVRERLARDALVALRVETRELLLEGRLTHEDVVVSAQGPRLAHRHAHLAAREARLHPLVLLLGL